ncbi:MAG: TVP38/TMEM64 family protein [Chloroflexi bacterium]|nr:TVP38/TMEM64 family protein [Chloroflexota bacterium]
MTQSNEKEYMAQPNFVPVTATRIMENGRDILRKYRNSIIALIIVGILGIVGWQIRRQLLDLFDVLSDQEATSAYIQSFGVLGPLVLGLGHYLQVIIAFIPGHVFVLAGGYLYGFLPGLALNMFFVVSASQFAFYLAKKAGRPLVGKLVDTKTLDKWEAIANKRGITFFTIAFVLPVFPTDAMNFVAGLSGMDGRKFLIANFFGRLPSVAAMTFIGAYGIEFSNTAWTILIIVVVLVYVIGRYTILQIERQHEVHLNENSLADSNSHHAN